MNTQPKIPSHSIDRAYAQLSDWDKMLLERQVEWLQSIRNVGPAMARQIIAHIEAKMEEMNERTQ